MKRFTINTIALLILLVLSTTAFSQTEIEMEEDAEKLHSLYKQVKAIPDFRVGSTVWYKAGENYPRFQKALEGIDKTRLIKENSEPFLKELVSKYLPNVNHEALIPRALERKFAPLDLGYETAFEYKEILFRFKIVETAGEENASVLVKKVKEYIEDNEKLVNKDDRFRMDALNEFNNLLTITPMFVPEGHRLIRRSARLEPQLAELTKKYQELENKLIAEVKWQNGISKISTGTPTSVAAAAKTYLTTRGVWGGKDPVKQTKILKVEMIRDWFVADSIIGIPLKYGISGVVAVSDKTMSPGVITVYEVSFITKGAKKTTDFNQIWVRNVSRMLEKNLPKK